MKTEELDKILTKSFLEERYVVQGIQSDKIALEVGCSNETVRNRLKKFGLFVGGLQKVKSARYDQLLTEEVLRKYYLEQELSITQIAELTDTSRDIVGYRLARFSIPMRDGSTSKKGKFLRENSSNWKGGVSPLSDAIRESIGDGDWRNRILRRDHYMCLGCGVEEKLEVHHVRPFSTLLREFLQLYPQLDPIRDKETLIKYARTYKPFWDIKNGETLCEKCHDKKRRGTNFYIVSSKPRLFCGIDNGVSGSFAILSEDGKVQAFFKPPTVSGQDYTQKIQNVTRIVTTRLKELLSPYRDAKIMCFLERPMINATRFRASLSAIRAFEATLIVLDDLSLPYDFVDSKAWQKALLPAGLKGSDELKKASLDVGKRLFPSIDFKGLKDADSLLIAEYQRRKETKE